VSIYAEEEPGLVQSDVGTDAESEGKQQSIRVRQECWPEPLEVAWNPYLLGRRVSAVSTLGSGVPVEGHPWKCGVVATLGRR
jgi:hypothetical protein